MPLAYSTYSLLFQNDDLGIYELPPALQRCLFDEVLDRGVQKGQFFSLTFIAAKCLILLLFRIGRGMCDNQLVFGSNRSSFFATVRVVEPNSR